MQVFISNPLSIKVDCVKIVFDDWAWVAIKLDTTGLLKVNGRTFTQM